MRIKNGFVLREIGGQTVVIATGEASKEFHGMIKLNSTGKEIWEGVAAGMSENEIVGKLVKDYGILIETAEADTRAMIKQMKEAGFLAE